MNDKLSNLKEFGIFKLSKDEAFKPMSTFDLTNMLMKASRSGEIDVFRYVLMFSELKDNPPMDFINRFVLKSACEHGQLEVVKYLLTSTDLKQNADIHTGDDVAFIEACFNGHIELVKYLLESTDLKSHPNVHAQKDEAFKSTFYNSQFEVLKYLIFEFNIEKTEFIEVALSRGVNGSDQVNNWFELRKLNAQLSEDLMEKDLPKKGVKI